MDLIQELTEKLQLLDQTISEIKKRGRELAECERNYRVSLASKILTERADGQPVTIINDICRGDEIVAELKLKRDIADSMYTSVQEAINVYKIQVRILESTINREYNSRGI